MKAWWFGRKAENDLAASKSNGVIESPPILSENGSPGPGGDLRASVPALGLKEYWYPALPARRVQRKPLFWNMLGEELVFFQDSQGKVVALTDVCPHRGASLSDGACFYKGYLSCPYHGATFDGQGNCAAFLTEGPDSKMVGNLKAQTYPTQTLRGWVFVWMGRGKPAPIEEDVPPEFFESGNTVLSAYTYWHTNWLLAIENHSDSHNAFYLHRNSLKQLLGPSSGRLRTPVGPRGKVVNNRGLVTTHSGTDYYAKEGVVPYQMYYPGVQGLWPLHRWRFHWKRFLKLFFRKERRPEQVFKSYEEWGLGHHLPCVVRTGGGSTRYAVAVKPNLSRIIYFYFPRVRNRLSAALANVVFHMIRRPLEFNFSSQDGRAASSCRFWTPEYLAPTDSQLVLLRRLITEHSRDALQGAAQQNGPYTEGAEVLRGQTAP